MEAEGIDFLVVLGEYDANPDLAYMVACARVHGGPLVKKRGEPPVLLYHPMEIEEARRSGCRLLDVKDLGLDPVVREAASLFEILVARHAALFERLGVAGRVAFAGRIDAGTSLHLLTALQEKFDIEIHHQVGEGILDRARLTKDAGEIERIRRAGVLTCRIITETIAYLRGCRPAGGVLHDNGAPVTIGAVKERLRLDLARAGMFEDGTTIFAQGRDGGIPHSRGAEGDPVRTGVPTVFDFFPRAADGYHFDVTRTFCLGEAPAPFLVAFETCARALEVAEAHTVPGSPVTGAQEAVCEFFEERGHPTLRSDPKTTAGYCHSLGHGIGLAIHESPSMYTSKSNRTCFEKGMVVTLEPGLYYPDDGYGVRIENVYVIGEKGPENLTDLEVQPVYTLR